MKKKLLCLTAVLCLLLSSCGEGNVDTEADGQADYIVNIDESFNSGIELDDSKKLLSAEEADFRSLKWGMTRDEVAYAEGNSYREIDANTIYYTRVREEGFPADAEYKFTDSGLVQGVFYIKNNKDDKAVTVDDYNELVSSLKERFKEPEMSDEVYTNQEDKTDDKAKQLKLIESGELQLRTKWTIDDTELRVVMFPKDDTACIGLQYKKNGVEIPTE